ncbi:hypothetical protein QZH41_019170 [Actinostola sp. cb2023]|nr:hypothetical protein QZH41_019170 [Actinostola sp. cb2023]
MRSSAYHAPEAVLAGKFSSGSLAGRFPSPRRRAPMDSRACSFPECFMILRVQARPGSLEQIDSPRRYHIFRFENQMWNMGGRVESGSTTLKMADNVMHGRDDAKKIDQGVYFTSLSPYTDPTSLALNNFTNGGTQVTDELYRKICSVIQITFQEHEVQKIFKRNRDIYLYRGSIALSNYEGRYQIYRNPNYTC